MHLADKYAKFQKKIARFKNKAVWYNLVQKKV